MQLSLGILILIYALWNCSAAFGGEVWNNISVGKFYKFSKPPSAAYPDQWPVTVSVGGSSRELSHGSKLTDGEVDPSSSPWPLEKWVAWHNTPFDVTIDLGKSYPVSHIHARAASRTEWAIAYPAKLTISVSSDGINWSLYGSWVGFRPSIGAEWEVQEVQGTGGWAYDTRFVRYAFEPFVGQYIFLDELWVEGSISHTTKEASHDGAYHGAFPSTEEGYLRLNEFEKEMGRRATMVLWYAGWDASFTTTVGQLIDDPKSPNWIGDRRLEIGFLPVSSKNPDEKCQENGTCLSCTQNSSCITSAKIAAGSHDQFLFDWFVEAATRNRPLWIRPMNEMNGSWTGSKNNPPDNYMMFTIFVMAGIRPHTDGPGDVCTTSLSRRGQRETSRFLYGLRTFTMSKTVGRKIYESIIRDHNMSTGLASASINGNRLSLMRDCSIVHITVIIQMIHSGAIR
jgi:hypothetical protein